MAYQESTKTRARYLEQMLLLVVSVQLDSTEESALLARCRLQPNFLLRIPYMKASLGQLTKLYRVAIVKDVRLHDDCRLKRSRSSPGKTLQLLTDQTFHKHHRTVRISSTQRKSLTRAVEGEGFTLVVLIALDIVLVGAVSVSNCGFWLENAHYFKHRRNCFCGVRSALQLESMPLESLPLLHYSSLALAKACLYTLRKFEKGEQPRLTSRECWQTFETSMVIWYLELKKAFFLCGVL